MAYHVGNNLCFLVSGQWLPSVSVFRDCLCMLKLVYSAHCCLFVWNALQSSLGTWNDISRKMHMSFCAVWSTPCRNACSSTVTSKTDLICVYLHCVKYLLLVRLFQSYVDLFHALQSITVWPQGSVTACGCKLTTGHTSIVSQTVVHLPAGLMAQRGR